MNKEIVNNFKKLISDKFYFGYEGGENPYLVVFITDKDNNDIELDIYEDKKNKGNFNIIDIDFGRYEKTNMSFDQVVEYINSFKN